MMQRWRRDTKGRVRECELQNMVVMCLYSDNSCRNNRSVSES